MKKLSGLKIELMPNTTREGRALCTECDGIGWLQSDNEKTIVKCNKCYDGLIYVCPDCGESKFTGYCNSEQCKEKREKEKDEKQYQSFLKSKKLKPEEYDKSLVVYSDDVDGYNDGYFADVYELIDYCEDNDIEIPYYVYGTYTSTFFLDIDDAIESALEDMHEDAEYMIDDKSLSELRLAVDKFNKENEFVKTYYKDDSTTIILKEHING